MSADAPLLVKALNLCKTFPLAAQGGGPVSLREALRRGRQPEGSRRPQRFVQALCDVSFELRAGERLGIIGRNGAGKTTLLSLLAGITTPDTGSVEVFGQVHAMLTIGAVLREDATGHENVLLDAAVHGHAQAEGEALVEKVAAFAELGDFMERPVRTYSSGMKARLAFAMGAFVKPDILVLDETLSVGDAFFADKATRHMRELAASGRSVIVVSHGLQSIVEMCTRCIWLDAGRVVMDGSPALVTAAYEADVRQADEAELARKFGDPPGAPPRPDAGTLRRVSLGARIAGRMEEIAATTPAFAPLSIRVAGEIGAASQGAADLALRLLRVDGRLVWSERLSQTGGALPARGGFQVEVGLDPFPLAANLYRLDAALVDAAGAIAQSSRVFEVVDEEGQAGGQPFLYWPPAIAASRIGKE